MERKIDYLARIAMTITAILFATAIFSIIIFISSFNKLLTDIISAILLVISLVFSQDIREFIEMIWEKN
jgi:hypothetical protein